MVPTVRIRSMRHGRDTERLVGDRIAAGFKSERRDPLAPFYQLATDSGHDSRGASMSGHWLFAAKGHKETNSSNEVRLAKVAASEPTAV